MDNFKKLPYPPTKKIIFYYTNHYGKKQSIETVCKYAREFAIQLLEATQFDKISEVYYTIGTVTNKLDYYNTEV